jgi:hypothetical protein
MKLPLLAISILLASVAACDGGDPGAGLGEACGGRTGATCAADQYCDFGNNRCGADDVTGRCTTRPTFCPALLVAEPTCGCDQRVYASACDALLAGADLNEGGTCPVDPGAFVCGYRQCSRSTEYCRRLGSDIAGEPPGFDCAGLPSGCGTSPSCSCLAGQDCSDLCAGDAAAGLTVTCPGG